MLYHCILNFLCFTFLKNFISFIERPGRAEYVHIYSVSCTFILSPKPSLKKITSLKVPIKIQFLQLRQT